MTTFPKARSMVTSVLYTTSRSENGQVDRNVVGVRVGFVLPAEIGAVERRIAAPQMLLKFDDLIAEFRPVTDDLV